MIRRLPMLRTNAVWPVAILAIVALDVPVAIIAATRSGDYRLLFAVAVGAALVASSLRWPATGMVLTLVAFLPFMALIRRLLIAPAGWSSYDPLLLVGPVAAAALLARVFLVERRPLVTDRLSRLVLGLLLLTLVEVVNPFGSGLTAGLGGLLFLAIPVLWFLIGRDLMSRWNARVVLRGAVFVSVVVACYGLWQSQVGLPTWDRSWVSIAGYSSLNLGGNTLRSFGTLSSSAEYASYLQVGLAVSLALLAHRRWAYALAAPILLVALFLDSTRGAMVSLVVVVIVLISLRQPTTRRALLAILAGLLVAVGTQTLLAGRLAATAAHSTNRAVSHQLGGLSNPFNPKQSTLLIHAQLVVSGFQAGVSNPVGHGTGSTNLAGAKFGSASAAASSPQNSELDISNAFISSGLVGGLLYLTVVILALRRAVCAYRRTEDPIVLAATLVLVSGLGQWLTGGQYAVAPLMWTLIGWTSTEFLATVGLSEPTRRHGWSAGAPAQLVRARLSS